MLKSYNLPLMDKNQTLNPICKVSMTTSLVDREWVEIVETIRDVNSSNFAKWTWSKSWTNLVWLAFYSTHLEHQPLGLWVALPPL